MLTVQLFPLPSDLWNDVSSPKKNPQTNKQKLFSVLTRTFCTASVREPSQRRSSTSSLHGEDRRRRGDGGGGGGGVRFWSGAVRLPDPPALCACRLQTESVRNQAGRRRQNPEQDGIIKNKEDVNILRLRKNLITRLEVFGRPPWEKSPNELTQTESVSEESL